jgi:transcriptional regulator with XRE-family HTH domain
MDYTLPLSFRASLMKKSIYSQSYQVFLRRLKLAREDAGLSQEDVAKRLGRTQSFVSKCERGERRIDIIELRDFCCAIGVDFRQFVAAIDKELGDKR